MSSSARFNELNTCALQGLLKLSLPQLAESCSSTIVTSSLIVPSFGLGLQNFLIYQSFLHFSY